MQQLMGRAHQINQIRGQKVQKIVNVIIVVVFVVVFVVVVVGVVVVVVVVKADDKNACQKIRCMNTILNRKQIISY